MSDTNQNHVPLTTFNVEPQYQTERIIPPPPSLLDTVTTAYTGHKNAKFKDTLLTVAVQHLETCDLNTVRERVKSQTRLSDFQFF
jgi:hypothetical protein